jgi:hypothetical protein
MNDPDRINEEFARELTREVQGVRDESVVRRDCAFCHYERSRKDDNHAPDCPYWDYFPHDR